VREHEDDSKKSGDIVTISRRCKIWQASFQLGSKQRRRSLKTTSKKETRRLPLSLLPKLLKEDTATRFEHLQSRSSRMVISLCLKLSSAR
jgi:hypothetical protein